MKVVIETPYHICYGCSMQKEFDQWNEKKKLAQAKIGIPFFRAREVWWCTLGVNVGSEEDGSGEEYRRPVVILKGLSGHTCLIVPLTTATQKHHFRLSLGIVDKKHSFAMLSQIRTIDTKRFVRKIGYVDKDVFYKIRKAVKDML
jgi:mRNA-degrading endonuclease toxin of MazEF toxin-antitoxin module